MLSSQVNVAVCIDQAEGSVRVWRRQDERFTDPYVVEQSVADTSNNIPRQFIKALFDPMRDCVQPYYKTTEVIPVTDCHS